MPSDRPAAVMDPSRSIAASTSALPGPIAKVSPQTSCSFSFSAPTRTSLADQHVARLDEHGHLVAFGKREVGDRLLGDVGGDDDAVSDVYLDRTVHRAWLNGGDPACDLVACADLHGDVL